MKRYSYLFILGAAAFLLGGAVAGFWLLGKKPVKGSPVPGSVLESETVEEEFEAEGQRYEKMNGTADGILKKEGCPREGELAAGLLGDQIRAEQEKRESRQEEIYCLVSENGFLLVFAKDRDAVCLDTHMPLSEFPMAEQERLLDGIWFSSMIEVLNYLESFTS